MHSQVKTIGGYFMCETAACARFSLEGGEDWDKVVQVYDTKKPGETAVASMTLPEYGDFLKGMPPTAHALLNEERGFSRHEAEAAVAWARLGYLSVEALTLAGPDGVTAKTGDIPTTPFAPDLQAQAAVA